VDALQLDFLRALLGVGSRGVWGTAVLAEFGRFPVSHFVWKQAVAFYNRLCAPAPAAGGGAGPSLPPNRLLLQAWHAQLSLLASGAQCWARALHGWLAQHLGEAGSAPDLVVEPVPPLAPKPTAGRRRAARSAAQAREAFALARRAAAASRRAVASANAIVVANMRAFVGLREEATVRQAQHVAPQRPACVGPPAAGSRPALGALTAHTGAAGPCPALGHFSLGPTDLKALQAAVESRYLATELYGPTDSNLRKCYLQLKPGPYECEGYLVAVRVVQLRKALARFRLGCNVLEVVKGRWARPPIAFADRVCRCCESGAVDDESHFLLKCPALEGVRCRYRSTLGLSQAMTVGDLMRGPHPLALSKYVAACVQHRIDNRCAVV
jgi:hypothetical protein